eukprot:TRINITY_DN985_c0_g1_i4.p1 TRINITY_DN985_c0_g1~~TRINITY_DN985_c0_g1_i4.p1  ORF type:complete len:137 (+),score=25.42 TRINITY_DN985_c0_g1_i4:156-566(+)
MRRVCTKIRFYVIAVSNYFFFVVLVVVFKTTFFPFGVFTVVFLIVTFFTGFFFTDVFFFTTFFTGFFTTTFLVFALPMEMDFLGPLRLRSIVRRFLASIRKKKNTRKNKNLILYPMYSALIPVSYTHLTLPTIYSV